MLEFFDFELPPVFWVVLALEDAVPLVRDLADPKLGIIPRLRPDTLRRGGAEGGSVEGRDVELLTLGLETTGAAAFAVDIGAPAPRFQTFFTAPTAPFKKPKRE